MLTINVWLWLGAVALFAFLEAVTWTLVSIWFALGALVCVFAAYFGAPVAAQLMVFIIVSLIAIAALRPAAKLLLRPGVVPTNADRLLGATGRVTEGIDNAGSRGAVYLDGKIWTARSAGGQIIHEGELVEVERLEGVKLIVRQKAAAPTY